VPSNPTGKNFVTNTVNCNAGKQDFPCEEILTGKNPAMRTGMGLQ